MCLLSSSSLLPPKDSLNRPIPPFHPTQSHSIPPQILPLSSFILTPLFHRSSPVLYFLLSYCLSDAPAS